jgi:hypothetical protein
MRRSPGSESGRSRSAGPLPLLDSRRELELAAPPGHWGAPADERTW